MRRIFEIWKTAGKAMGRRGRPKSRARRAADAAAATVVGAYLLVLCFPQLVFAHSESYGRFRVYSAAPLGPNLHAVLDRADRRLAACEIDEPHAVHRVFVCPNHAVFAFFSPRDRDAFAINQAFVHNIFINTADVAGDAVTTGATPHGRRTLSGTIAHECTHTLLADRFGQIAILQKPSWKQEGYCDWVSGDPSFDKTEGARLLAEGRSDPSASFFYFRAYTAVGYLEDREHWDVSRIMSASDSLDAILERARKE